MDFVRLRTAAAAAMALLGGCTREEAARPPAAAAPPPAAASEPAFAPAPPPSPTLDRAALLAAVAEAAAAAAVAAPYPDAAAALAGRRFSLRLPFGCGGPASEAAAGWTYDAARGTLKVTVQPERWTEAPWAQALAGTPDTDAIEGFWVRRPWITSEACPAAVAAPQGEPEAETVGLARVFERSDSRLPQRGGRAYEFTEKVPPQPPPAQGGLRLVLEGRIAEPSAGRPVRCQVGHPDRRPLCLVLADVDRVAVEDASGRQLAEWAS